MKTPFRRLLTLAALSLAVLVPGTIQVRIPVVLVTDIGTDIDDTWAMALALRSPELDLKLVLVDPADTAYRAKVAAKFLEASGHAAVEIAIGDNGPVNGDQKRTLLSWVGTARRGQALLIAFSGPDSGATYAEVSDEPKGSHRHVETSSCAGVMPATSCRRFLARARKSHST